MRRVFVPLLLASACSGSPPPPPPAPVPAPVSPPASASAAAPEPAPRLPWLELTGTVVQTVLVAHAPEGEELYKAELGHAFEVLGTPDGGAFAVASEPSGKTGQTTTGVLHVDARGKELWRTPLERGGYTWRLFVVGERLYVFDFSGPNPQGNRLLHVFDVASGKRVRTVELYFSEVDAHGGVIAVADRSGVVRLGPDGDPAWSVRVGRFPSLDPTVTVGPRRVAVGFDGTVITGESDGSLVAFDPEGKPLYQLGVRGGVNRIRARSAKLGGGFVVSAGDGLVTVERGVVREEVAPSPPEGVRIEDKRKGGRSTTAADVPTTTPAWKPTLAFRARREGPSAEKPFHHVQSVVAAAPDDVWVLGRVEQGPDSDDDRLFHHDGKAWSDLGPPRMAFPKEVFAEGVPARASRFLPLGLGRGANGALLALGVRVGGVVRPSVIERVGSAWRERREIRDVLAKIPIEEATRLSYTASPGGHEVLCNSEPAVCVEFGRGVTPRILPDDQAREMPGVFDTSVVFAGETLWRTNGSANGEADVWGTGGVGITHWNGAEFEDHESPVLLRSLWAGGRDDVWATGEDGDVTRFDGQRWFRVLGVERGGRLTVTGSRRGDVWVYGEAGLWRVTPEPQAEPDLEGTPSPPPPAAAPSVVLPVAGADASYRLEPVVLELDGQKPLRAALHLAEGPGGVLWFSDGARVVEYDGTRARLLYQAPKPEPFYCWYAPEPDCNLCAQCTKRKPAPLGCQRCAAPVAPGEGGLLTAEGWLRVTGGRVAPEPLPLSELLAVTVAKSGAIWAVSAADDDLPRAMVKGPRGSRLVLGLPPAAYVDVSVRAEDDVWFAGGLTRGAAGGRVVPEGEGTLVRFDGRVFTRHRAPDGALLSVAAAGPGEAWAVGLGGGLLHAKGSVVEAFHLEHGGARLPLILRGVAASGPNEVWMVGDGSTLLRWDGKALRRVDTRAAGKVAALSAVIAPGAKPGWVVGPGGIWRVVQAR